MLALISVARICLESTDIELGAIAQTVALVIETMCAIATNYQLELPLTPLRSGNSATIFRIVSPDKAEVCLSFSVRWDLVAFVTAFSAAL